MMIPISHLKLPSQSSGPVMHALFVGYLIPVLSLNAETKVVANGFAIIEGKMASHLILYTILSNLSIMK